MNVTTIDYEIGDLVLWIDPLYHRYEEPDPKYMKVYGIVVGHNDNNDAKVFWFDRLDPNVCYMPNNEIKLVSRASNEKHVLKEEQMIVSSINNAYIYKINNINSNIKKDEKTREARWLCVHCKAGVVYKLPARCPECEKFLNEEIVRNK
jgi:hypothetical protein